MKRALLSLSLCALFASSAFAQKGKPSTSSCPADITNLQVTFADRVDPSGALIDLFRSDGGGPYITTKSKGENIDIKFQRANCTYDFTMNLNFSKRTTKLTLGAGGVTLDSDFFNFDRVASVPVTQDKLNSDGSTTSFLNSQFCMNYYAIDPATGKPALNPDGTVQDNYAGCGIDGDGKYFVRRSVGMQAGDDNHGFRYQYSPIDGGPTWAAGTDYIRVYHPSATVWEVVPDVGMGSCSGGSCGRYYDKSTSTLLGDYSVPFKITVTN